MSCGLIPTFLLYMFPTAHSLRLTLSLCLSLFLSPLNCHHLVLRPLSNCPRPLIVLINVVHFTWLCSFPIPRLFFQSHSFVSLWQTDKEELVGEVLHLWPMAAISYEGPWERDTHQNLLWPETCSVQVCGSKWNHIATRGTIANFSINSSSTVFFFRSTNVINIWTV